MFFAIKASNIQGGEEGKILAKGEILDLINLSQ